MWWAVRHPMIAFDLFMLLSCMVAYAAPSSEDCTVARGVDAVGTTVGLKMRVAPCSRAAAVQANGQDLFIPPGGRFKYVDRNTRQISDCNGYDYEREPDVDYCWVLGEYDGYVGWVPVQEVPPFNGFSGGWTSAMCTYFVDTPLVLVSDDGSATGCAQLTPDLTGVPGECFPGDATVPTRNGQLRISQLQIGDEVAVRLQDGSVGFEAVYAFGHRDDRTVAQFTELAVAAKLSKVVATSVQVSWFSQHQGLYRSTVGGPQLWMLGKLILRSPPAFVEEKLSSLHF